VSRLPFQVVYVDPEDGFLLFGEQDRSLGWIYSREKTISGMDHDRVLGKFRGVGYDTSQFRRVIQLPEQIGKSGFWSDYVKAAEAGVASIPSASLKSSNLGDWEHASGASKSRRLRSVSRISAAVRYIALFLWS
jgi:hypothetical protein